MDMMVQHVLHFFFGRTLWIIKPSKFYTGRYIFWRNSDGIGCRKLKDSPSSCGYWIVGNMKYWTMGFRSFLLNVQTNSYWNQPTNPINQRAWVMMILSLFFMCFTKMWLITICFVGYSHGYGYYVYNTYIYSSIFLLRNFLEAMVPTSKTNTWICWEPIWSELARTMCLRANLNHAYVWAAFTFGHVTKPHIHHWCVVFPLVESPWLGESI